MKVREFKKNDFKNLLNLIVEFEFDKQISFENNKISREKIHKTNKKNLTEFIKDKTFKYFVCEEEDNLMGYIFLNYDKNLNEGFINEVYVLPNKRRNGYAKKLVERGMEWLNKNKCNTIDLTVNLKNKSAISLYENLGFEKHQDNYITMRKSIG